MRRLLIVVLLSLSGLALSVGTAMAHDKLASSDPAPGSTLTAVPHRVTLTFEEAPDASGATMTVVGASGNHVEVGAPVISGSTVAVNLAPAMSNGAYTVDWRVVSDDGHPVSGTFSFSVAVPTAAAAAQTATALAAAAAAPTAAAPAAQAQPPADSGSGGFPSWWVIVAVVAAAVLAVIVLALRSTRVRR